MADTGSDPVLPDGSSPPEGTSPDAGWRKLGAPAGLCETCRHGKLNETRKGTAYLRCTRAAWDDRVPRYPRLPVASCIGYERSADHGPAGRGLRAATAPVECRSRRARAASP